MPVPDMQPRFRDWTYCEICEKSYTDDKFVAVVVDNDKSGAENEKRTCYICKNCREKCRTDREYEKTTTEKIFRQRFGSPVVQKVRSLAERLSGCGQNLQELPEADK